MKVKIYVTGDSPPTCVALARKQLKAGYAGLTESTVSDEIRVDKISLRKTKGVGRLQDKYDGSVTFKW